MTVYDQIRIDLQEGADFWSPFAHTLYDATNPEDPILYQRTSRRVERYEGTVRTHVFHVKIPAHKWANVLNRVRAQLEAEPADDALYVELAASGTYTPEQLRMMREEWGLTP